MKLFVKLLILMFVSVLVGCNELGIKSDDSHSKVPLTNEMLNVQSSCENDIKLNKHSSVNCEKFLDLTMDYTKWDVKDISIIRNKYFMYNNDKQNLEQYSPEQLSKKIDKDICLTFRSATRSGFFAKNAVQEKYVVSELLKRGFKKKDIDDARKGTVTMGMPVCMLYVARGSPDHENKTVHSFGVNIQHVYNSSDKYFYSKNNKITSWSTHK